MLLENVSLLNEPLLKSITRTQAKSVHKDLPEGGVWRTIRGHHVYIVKGKVVAGSIPGVTGKAKKATKADLAEHQATIDKEAKAGKSKAKGKKDATASKKTPTATKPATAGKKTAVKPPKATAKAPKSGTAKTGGTGKKASEVKPPKAKGAGKDVSKTKGQPAKSVVPPKATPKKAKAPAPAKPEPKAKPPKAGKQEPPKKQVKDIRSEAQANRDVAYDVGQKVGGARKDLAESVQRFKDKPTYNTLEELEAASPEMAQKFVTKANLIPTSEDQFLADHKNGVELTASMLKNLIYSRVAPKPQGNTPEDRREYVKGITELRRVLEPVKSFEDMRKAVRDLSDIASKGYSYNRSNQQGLDYRKRMLESGMDGYRRELTPADRAKYTAEAKDYENRLKESAKVREQFPFEAMGEKLKNFFTDYDSRNRTYDTLRKNMQGKTWENQLKTPEGTGAPKKTNKAAEERKKWERRTASQYERTGGKDVKINKPEDMVKHFGMRGVEFGNWVDDSSGMYHLKRSAEAFQDMSELLGIDVKDMSLNGKLAMAFGARGKGGALAHYEPEMKVINMTKHGGAGSLAHEWGHAMDNIMYQYSHGGSRSISLASEGGMGDYDDGLKKRYDALMEAIHKGDGSSGGVKKVAYDTSDLKNRFGNYYPEMRRDAESGMSMEDIHKKWTDRWNKDYDTKIERIKKNPYYGSDNTKRQKEIDKTERERTRILNQLAHRVAIEKFYASGDHKKPVNEQRHLKGVMEIPTGKSEYASRMEEKGKYWAEPAEMFARVFESYIEDKMQAKKRKNNYLVYDTKTTTEGHPFPVGSERKHMTQKMDDLIQYIAQSKSLKKALELDLIKSLEGKLASMDGVSEVHPSERNAYRVPSEEGVFYIPVNRIRTPYQTEQATNWDKVVENAIKISLGVAMEPLVIGYDHDLYDGHHRYEASKLKNCTHVPCIIGGQNEIARQRATEKYSELWKSLEPGKLEGGEWKTIHGAHIYVKGGKIVAGGSKEMHMSYVRINRPKGEKTANFGTTYAQDIEPHGEYMSHDTNDGKNRIDLPNYEYGKVHFKNPYVLEHESTGHGGWKTKLSEAFGGRKGKALSNAIKKKGHDGIIAMDSKAGHIIEAVNLAGEKAPHDLQKSIVVDPVADNPPFAEDGTHMYRGIGQKELRFIQKNGYIQTKGKGNDDDKDVKTCFSNLWRQAVGYARSNYDLYNEPQAYVLILPKPDYVTEDETGELVSDRKVPVSGIGMAIIPIPKDDRIAT